MLVPNGNITGYKGNVIFANAIQISSGNATVAANYALPEHAFRSPCGIGLLICDLNEAVSSDTTSVMFTVNGTSVPVTSQDGGDLDITDITAGLHIFMFDKFSGNIQFIV